MDPTHPVIQILDNILSRYFRSLDQLFSTSLRLFGVKVSLRVRETGNVDERILKIELARQNLLEGLEALDDLKDQADENKRALEDALRQIERAENKKAAVQTELSAMQAVAGADVTAIRKVLDLPTTARIWRERLFGLVTGVIASMIAAFFWSLLTKG